MKLRFSHFNAESDKSCRVYRNPSIPRSLSILDLPHLYVYVQSYALKDMTRATRWPYLTQVLHLMLDDDQSLDALIATGEDGDYAIKEIGDGLGDIFRVQVRCKSGAIADNLVLTMDVLRSSSLDKVTKSWTFTKWQNWDDKQATKKMKEKAAQLAQNQHSFNNNNNNAAGGYPDQGFDGGDAFQGGGGGQYQGGGGGQYRGGGGGYRGRGGYRGGGGGGRGNRRRNNNNNRRKGGGWNNNNNQNWS